MKKFLAVLLAVVWIVASFPFTAVAAPTDHHRELYEAFCQRATAIDIGDWNYTAAQINDLFYETLSTYPDLFFVSKELKYDVSQQSGTVVTLRPAYVYDETQVRWALDQADAIVAKADENWSDLELALFYHDYLGLHFQYDLRLYDEELEDEVARDMYAFFRDGTGVCEAYAQTYQYLLHKSGVECLLVASLDAEHEWNMVRIDGHWYHVDISVDDPVMADVDENGYITISVLDHCGFVSHRYFMKSDEAIYDEFAEDGLHYDWYIPSGEDARASRRFDSGYVFESAISAFVPIDGVWYYWQENEETATLYGTKDFIQVLNPLQVIDKVWRCEAEGFYYPTLYSGLVRDGAYLVYNTDDGLHWLDPLNGTVIKTVSLSQLMTLQNTVDCFGNDVSVVPENVFAYGLVDVDRFLVLQCSGYAVDDVYYLTWYDRGVTGDANGDGVVDTADLLILKKYLAGILDCDDLSGMDCDHNGAVDTTDLALLKKALAGLITLS